MADLVNVVHAGAVPEGEALVAVGVRSDHLADDTEGVDPALLEAAGFEGKVAQTRLVSIDGAVRLLVGLGGGDAIEPTTLRRAGAALARAAKREPRVVTTVLDLVADDRPAAASALAEGLVLGAYRFSAYKKASGADSAGRELAEVVVVAKGGQKIAAAIERGVVVAGAVSLARDLVNTPGGDLTPRELAKRAAMAAEAAGLIVEVLDKKAIAKEKLGGLLGVNRGSTEEPRFLRITHDPDRARGFVALVGKGITFDSGGLSLKTAAGMTDMKSDMGGAAAVIGAMTLVPTVAPR
ncbi:MAG TPA: M17 family peptidase N-terminal domain-containing protein, partial [Acidimicrobiales bacterium]